jgi:hypothetical protein
MTGVLLICNRSAKSRRDWSGPAGLLGLSLFLTACGGGGSSMIAPQAGPEAVLNGASLTTATSHWVSTRCEVEAELTKDKGFLSVVTDTAGTTTYASETWTTAASNANSVTVGPGLGGEGGAFWITSLGNINGSTSSQAFTANVNVQTQDNPQNLGSCTFTLTQKGLSLPAVSR